MKGNQLLRIAAVAVISVCIFGVNAETGNCDPDDSGSCTYTLTGTELVISGSGAMKDWGTGSSNLAPWRNGGCSLTKVTISGITRVGSYAFYQCKNLTSANINIQGSTVKSIGAYAFSGCTNIIEFTIPSGVNSLENYSFYGCTSLASITFPSSLTTLGAGIFSNTGFTGFVFPAGLTEIPPFYCSSCSKLKSVVIPEGITKISEKAFFNCNAMLTANVSASVTDLHRTAFSRNTQKNNLENIFVHKDNPNYADIDGVLFTKDKKTLILYPGYHSARYRIPEGVTHIGPYAFDFVTNNFWQINFSSTVTHIGERAFSNQGVSMDDLVIPGNVVHLDHDAFFNNKAQRVYYLGLHNPDPDGIGYDCTGFGTLFLPIEYEDSEFCGRKVSVKGNSSWDDYRGKDNECYQALYCAYIQNHAQCAQYPPETKSARALFAMRPEVYEKTHKNYGCLRYTCQNQTGLNETSNCYSPKVCINDVCVIPPSSSSSESSSDPHSESSHPASSSHHSESSQPASSSHHSESSHPASSSHHSESSQPASSSHHSESSHPASSSHHSESSHPASSSHHSESSHPASSSHHSESSHLISSVEPSSLNASTSSWFINSGLRSTASYLIVGLVMAFALLI